MFHPIDTNDTGRKEDGGEIKIKYYCKEKVQQTGGKFTGTEVKWYRKMLLLMKDKRIRNARK